MEYRSNRIKVQIDKVPNRYKNYFIQLYKKLLNVKTARGYMGEQTIYKSLQRTSHFLKKYCNNKIENISVENLKDYERNLSNSYNSMAPLKRFVEVLVDNNVLEKKTLEYFEEVGRKEKRNKIEVPGEEFKFIIPHDRWTEIFHHPRLKKSNARRMSAFQGLYLGMRENEMINLKISKDLFLDAKDPFIFIQKHPEDDYEPKTPDSIRRIYLDQWQVKEIKKYVTIRENFLKTKKMDNDFFLYDKDGDRVMATGTIWKWFVEIEMEFKEFGNMVKRKLRPHVLRYSCAWFYYKKTRNLYALSKFLGHSSVKETEEYLGLTESQKFDEIKLMVKSAFN